jgi:hypothetical protein
VVAEEVEASGRQGINTRLPPNPTG